MIQTLKQSFLQNKRNIAGAIKRDNLREDLFHQKGDGDELVNDDEINKQMQYENLCAAGDCSTIPDKNLMKLKVRYYIYFQHRKKFHIIITNIALIDWL